MVNDTVCVEREEKREKGRQFTRKIKGKNFVMWIM